MFRILQLCSISALLIVIVGCCNIHKTSVFEDGMPSERYLAGGGLNINYTAPSNGTAYVIDASSKKYIITKPLKENHLFTFEVPDTALFTELGLDVSQVSIKLYFVPDSEQLK